MILTEILLKTVPVHLDFTKILLIQNAINAIYHLVKNVRGLLITVQFAELIHSESTHPLVYAKKDIMNLLHTLNLLILLYLQ
jgi:hypothetical protein